MRETISNFLDLLTPSQLDKFASIMDEIELENELYQNGFTVEQYKTASLLNELVSEGFYDGLNDLSGSGDWYEFLGEQ